MFLWVVQVVNQAFIVVSEKGLWVMGRQIVVSLGETVLSHYELIQIEKTHIFVEPEETRDAIFVLILAAIAALVVIDVCLDLPCYWANRDHQPVWFNQIFVGDSLQSLFGFTCIF